MRGGSGIICLDKGDPKEALLRFIDGSVISEQMKITNNPDVQVYSYHNRTDKIYMSTDADTFGQIIDTILVKFITIRNTRYAFEQEVAIQKDIQ